MSETSSNRSGSEVVTSAQSQSPAQARLKPTDGRLKANRERKAQAEQMSAIRHNNLLDQYADRGWRQSWLTWLRELARDRGYDRALVAARLAQRIIDSLDSTSPGATDWQALHEGAIAQITELEDQVLELQAQLEPKPVTHSALNLTTTSDAQPAIPTPTQPS